MASFASGSMFGELAVLDGGVRSASEVAVENTGGVGSQCWWCGVTVSRCRVTVSVVWGHSVAMQGHSVGSVGSQCR